jgi:2-polyprenyl-3-methyl-5-hydroxy-6-metoxy-1,4-benzoquinol methylase
VVENPVCPLCAGAERSLVSPYNGLILLRSYEDAEVARYAYCLCHGCGVVYATNRPSGEQFVELLRNFDDNLGRVDRPNLGVVEGDLTEDEKAEIRRRMEAGTVLSEEHGPPDGPDTWAMLRHDRLSSAQDLTLLASSLDLRDARVLDVRSNAGALLDSLRSWFGAEVYAMPSFEADKIVIEEHVGIPAATLIDYENFSIPYEGEFDVILAKHMVTHAVRPEAFFEEIRAHLRPGGHLYLYVENDDSVMWQNRKNLLGELKCFHFQNFDLKVLTRLLRAQGFDPVWVAHLGRSSMSCLARLDPAVRADPLDATELEDRLELYRRWYDLSVLSLPPEISRAPFEAELEAIGERAVARGDATGRGAEAKPVKRLKLMHEDGYVELNVRLGAERRPAENGGGSSLGRAARAAAARVRTRSGRTQG